MSGWWRRSKTPITAITCWTTRPCRTASTTVLLRELEHLEREQPELASPDSPTQRIGHAVQSAFRKVKHRMPMLSLANAFSDEEVADFLQRIANTVPAGAAGILL